MNSEDTEQQEQEALEASAEELRQWENTDAVERRYELERVGQHFQEAFDAPAPPIYPENFEDPRLMGKYVDEDFRMEMQEQLLEQKDPRDALDTYLHEYRHAAQHYDVERSHGALAHEVDLDRTTEIEGSLDQYVSPDEDERAYFDQLAERDASSFAERMTERVLDEREERLDRK